MLAGAPPAKVALNMYLTLNTVGCTGPQLAPYIDAAFGTGANAPPLDFAATAKIALPAGQSVVTVCFAQASYLSFYGIKFATSGALSCYCCCCCS